MEQTTKFSEVEINLIRELKEYSKIYVNDLKALGHSDETIEKSINNWIVGTFEFYKKNNMNLEEALETFKFFNSNKPSINYSDQNNKEPITNK